MATQYLPVNQKRHRGFSKRKNLLLFIDMSPMVDLGFLLITFFIFTTTISTPSVTDLFMPKDKGIIRMQTIPDRLALTLLLASDDKIFYYHGDWEKARISEAIFETDYSYSHGIGEVIRNKQKAIDASGKFSEGRKGLILLIKPSGGATCGNVFDVLDELLINDVRKYALLDMEKQETVFLGNK